MFKKLTKIIIIFVLILFFLNRTNSRDYFNQKDKIISRIKSNSFALAADSMLGRGNGQNGLKIAENYIVAELNKLSKDNKAVIQKAPVLEILPKQESEFQIINRMGTKTLELNRDYLIHSSGLMKYIPNETEVVFAGYGIFASDIDYNDYNNLNVNGKIVLILEGTPEILNSKKEVNKYSVLEYKQKEALSRGASALLIIPSDIKMSKGKWEYRVQSYSRPEYNLVFGNNSIPTIIVNPYLIQELFDFQLPENNIINFLEKNNIKINTKIIFKPKYKDKSFTISNILYEIKGTQSGLNDDCLIFSAHYDHLGIGKAFDEDSIYNGFQDNSLGCALLFEIARYYTDTKPKKSVLFIWTAGEEIGLLGSMYYLNNPYYPLYKTLANINVDGVAFMDEFNSIIGLGADYSNLDAILENVAKENSLIVEKIDDEKFDMDAFSRSDQIAFAYSGIPSILILDGMNYKNIEKQQGIEVLYDYFANFYHSPFDDAHQQINWDAAIQHLSLILDFSNGIVNTDIIPEWYPNNRFYLQRLRTEVEKR